MRESLANLIERMALSEPGVDSSASVSWHAHREAETVTDLSALPELCVYLDSNPRPHLRAAAYFLIGKIGKNTGNTDCAAALAARAALEIDKYALSGLLNRLADLSKPIQIDLSPVFALLRDPRWLVRHSAIASLKNSVSPESELRILELLSGSTDSHDVAYCQATLNSIGTAISLPALRSRLSSRSRDVRMSAQLAIEAIEMRTQHH